MKPMIARLSLTAALLVSLCSVSAAAQTVPASVVPDAVIQPGDELSIAVFGDPSMTQTIKVSADGKIDYPMIGPQAVAGMSPVAAKQKITKALESYIKYPQVTLSVSAPGSMTVSVIGDVKTQGKFEIRAGGRLSDAIAAAGGFGPTNGALPIARITNPEGSTIEVSLEKLLRDGDDSLNVPLNDRSVVNVVGPNLFTVGVAGAVDRPGNVQLEEGQRLSMAIARAGTSPDSIADLNHVVITHTDPNGMTTKQVVNLYNTLLHGDMRSNPVLRKGDVVYVPQGTRAVAQGGVTPLSLLQNLLGGVSSLLIIP